MSGFHIAIVPVGKFDSEEIRTAEPDLLAAFESGDPDVRPGGGETRRELRTRVVAALIGLEPPAGDVVCVTHLGVVRAAVPGAEPANAALVSTTFDALKAASG